jgi:hypothetical protein
MSSRKWCELVKHLDKVEAKELAETLEGSERFSLQHLLHVLPHASTR